MEPEKKLTAKEEKFCSQYILHLNATRAAINSGYSEKTARSIGSKLLTKVNIQSRLKKMRDNLSETSEISVFWVLNEHKKIASASMAGLHETWYRKKDFEKLPEEVKACVSEIETKIKTEYIQGTDGKSKPVQVGFVKVKLYDKQKALDSISNILGFNASIRTELSAKIDFGKFTDEQLNQIIETIIKKQNG